MDYNRWMMEDDDDDDDDDDVEGDFYGYLLPCTVLIGAVCVVLSVCLV